MKYLKNYEDLKKHKEYLSWKRKNVSIRGITKFGELNNGGASMGEGLYTACLSNKELAKQYGKVYFLLNAKPKKPLKFKSSWYWEIYLQNLVIKLIGEYNLSKFFKKTTIKDEIMKLGYDGIEIIGREYVNYTPKDVLYFNNEEELKHYFKTIDPHI